MLKSRMFVILHTCLCHGIEANYITEHLYVFIRTHPLLYLTLPQTHVISNPYSTVI